MLHVFNDPVEPGSLAEFQNEFQNAEDEDVPIEPVLLTEFEKAKNEETLFSCQTVSFLFRKFIIIFSSYCAEIVLMCNFLNNS
uniref:Uncharacterized protein n=1 Tax=Onchocerca volvulus TaxID=6282 RepID=A0A8R1TMV7_ONCVO